jgi:hypothetical protein
MFPFAIRAMQAAGIGVEITQARLETRRIWTIGSISFGFDMTTLGTCIAQQYVLLSDFAKSIPRRTAWAQSHPVLASPQTLVNCFARLKVAQEQIKIQNQAFDKVLGLGSNLEASDAKMLRELDKQIQDHQNKTERFLADSRLKSVIGSLNLMHTMWANGEETVQTYYAEQMVALLHQTYGSNTAEMRHDIDVWVNAAQRHWMSVQLKQAYIHWVQKLRVFQLSYQNANNLNAYESSLQPLVHTLQQLWKHNEAASQELLRLEYSLAFLARNELSMDSASTSQIDWEALNLEKCARKFVEEANKVEIPQKINVSNDRVTNEIFQKAWEIFQKQEVARKEQEALMSYTLQTFGIYIKSFYTYFAGSSTEAGNIGFIFQTLSVLLVSLVAGTYAFGSSMLLSLLKRNNQRIEHHRTVSNVGSQQFETLLKQYHEKYKVALSLQELRYKSASDAFNEMIEAAKTEKGKKAWAHSKTVLHLVSQCQMLARDNLRLQLDDTAGLMQHFDFLLNAVRNLQQSSDTLTTQFFSGLQLAHTTKDIGTAFTQSSLQQALSLLEITVAALLVAKMHKMEALALFSSNIHAGFTTLLKSALDPQTLRLSDLVDNLLKFQTNLNNFTSARHLISSELLPADFTSNEDHITENLKKLHSAMPDILLGRNQALRITKQFDDLMEEVHNHRAAICPEDKKPYDRMSHHFGLADNFIITDSERTMVEEAIVKDETLFHKMKTALSEVTAQRLM